MMEKTEDKILEAANKIFLKKGLYGARMQDIADEAGINKALLHYYFRSKDKLYSKVLQSVIQEFFPRLFSLIDANMPFEDKIRKIVENYINLNLENPYFAFFILNEMHSRPENLPGIVKMDEIKTMKKYLQSEIDKEVKAGKIRHVKVEQLIANLVSLTIFPFAGKPMLMNIFSMNEKQYHDFLLERKELIPDIILNYLKKK